MSKNKEDKKTNFLTEEKAYEKYILMILSIAAIIYSVLIFLDVVIGCFAKAGILEVFHM